MADIVGTEVATGATSPSPSEFHPASIPSGGTFTASLEFHATTLFEEPPADIVIYRMRAYDSTLARIVFWNSGGVDSFGADYGGPGPLLDVVVQIVLGLPLLVLIPGTGIEAMPEQWVKLNVPASQPATTMFTQVSTNFDTIKAIREGSIVGLGTRLSQAVTAGLLTVTVTINGVAGALSIGHSSGVGDEATQATGIDTYVPGDLLGIQYSTDAGLLPAGVIDLEAWFQVVEVP